MPRLDGRVIIVTGGGQGIAQAFAKGFAAEGARVVIADVDGPAAEPTAAQIGEAGGDAIALVTDVSSEESTEAMARTVIERWGHIDDLMNNLVPTTVPSPVSHSRSFSGARARR